MEIDDKKAEAVMAIVKMSDDSFIVFQANDAGIQTVNGVANDKPQWRQAQWHFKEIGELVTALRRWSKGQDLA